MIRVSFISPLMLLGFFFNSSFKSNFINVFSFFNFLVLLLYSFYFESLLVLGISRESLRFGGNSFEFQALQLVVGLLLSLLRKKNKEILVYPWFVAVIMRLTDSTSLIFKCKQDFYLTYERKVLKLFLFRVIDFSCTR